MKDQILKLLTQRRYVTFQELSREIPGFSGDKSLDSAEYPGLVIWPRISLDATATLQELLKDGTIHLHDTIPLNYLIEGYVSPIPLAKNLRSYKSPRWVPMTISKEPPKVRKSTPKKPRRKV